MMKFRECSRERDVADSIRLGHWPAACAEDLRQHVAACQRCTDLVRVKTALANLRVRDAAAARLEVPGLLLWRAQMRRRNAALERATRPIQQASVFGLGVLLAVLLVLAAFGLRSGAEWDLAAAWQASGRLVLWGMVSILALLGGLVAYLAAERE